MAYYDRHHYPHDRYPRPSDPPYHGPMDVVPNRGSTDSISRDNYPSNHDYYGYSHGSGYGHGYPPAHSRPSRVATVQEGSRRPHGHGAYYDGYDDHHGHRRHRHHRSRDDYYDDHRDRSRRHHHKAHSVSPSPTRRGRSRSRARGSKKSTPRNKSMEKLIQAVRAATTAGSIEAFRVRREPGDWTGEKGKRVLTAALTAGGADGLVDKDPRKHEKRHIIESVLAGLVTNHFVNGPRSRSRSRSREGGGRGRSKSHNRGKELVAAGLVAAAGKKAYDHYRSKSRPRGGSRDRALSDEDGYESYDGSPRPSRGSKKRSKSVSDYINKGIASLGLEDSGDHDRRRRHHHHHRRRSSPPPSDGSYSDDSGTASDDSRRRYRSPPRRSHK